MSDHLPTDDEFLQLLYEATADTDYIAQALEMYEAVDVEQAYQEAVGAGVWSGDLAAFQKSFADVMRVERAFRGPFVSQLREGALRVLGDEARIVEHVPVGLFPTFELNGCAIRTPRDGSAILLDHGVIAHAMLIVRCTLAYITWHSDEPFCRDVSQAEYAAALVNVARYSVTGDYRHLAASRDALTFESVGAFDQSSPVFCILMETFILLHEYGHVICGHLAESALIPHRTHFGMAVDEYSPSEEAEFEADAFAIERLLRGSAASLLPSDVALAAGLVLKFFQLCEFISPAALTDHPRTHPPAAERWERVKSITHLLERSEALAMNLDPAFQTIFDALS